MGDVRAHKGRKYLVETQWLLEMMVGCRDEVERRVRVVLVSWALPAGMAALASLIGSLEPLSGRLYDWRKDLRYFGAVADSEIGHLES